MAAKRNNTNTTNPFPGKGGPVFFLERGVKESSGYDAAE
jgi:hypothetical protein